MSNNDDEDNKLFLFSDLVLNQLQHLCLAITSNDNNQNITFSMISILLYILKLKQIIGGTAKKMDLQI